MDAETRLRLVGLVKPYYTALGPFDGFDHAGRVLDAARALAAVEGPVDDDVLFCAAFLHDLADDESTVRRLTADAGLTGPIVDRVVQAAREADEESAPITPEGAILHDAHLTEGGPASAAIRAHVAGRDAGRPIEETAAILRDRLGRYRCVTPTGRAWQAENEAYVRYFLNVLVPRIARDAGRPIEVVDANPYAGAPEVWLVCPWCNDEATLPAALVGHDVLCPECFEVIYLNPGLTSGGGVRADRADTATFPRPRRCPRCRSRAVYRPARGLAAAVLIPVGAYWLYMSLAHGRLLLHPYADPLLALGLIVLGAEILLRPASRRCLACGHRWR